jgi:hypothetical protein
MPAMEAFLCLELRCWLACTETSYDACQLTSQGCCCLNEDWLVFFIRFVSWVLANIVIQSFMLLKKWSRNPRQRCLYNGLFAQIFLSRLIYPQSKSVEVGRGCGHGTWHCCSWWRCCFWLRWLSDTFWAALMKIWPTALICWVTFNLWSVVVEYAGGLP